MKNILKVLLVILYMVIAPSSMSQPGILDQDFGNSGSVVGPTTDVEEQVYKVAIQPNNMIVVAGFQVEGMGNQNFMIARYHPDGSPDVTFGNTGLGFATFDGGTDSDAAWDMIIQNDGKILAGGSVYNQLTTYDDFAMVRFNTDGSPDMAFGNNGLVVTDINGYWDNAYAIDIQNNGKILLAGDGYTGSRRSACVVRYLADGTPDPSFGNGGIALHSIGSERDHLKALAIQADGKILIAGHIEDGVDLQTFVTRLNPDGTIDNTFGNNGTATLDIGGNDDKLWQIIIRPDGKIVAAGSTGLSGNWDYMLLQYTTDGSLDNTFGSNGIALSNFGINDLVLDMILQPDGKILTAGGGFIFELVRFNEDGYPDIQFGDNGKVNTSFSAGLAFSQSLAWQADGKIVVAGHTRNPDEYDIAICRYYSEDEGFIEEEDNVFTTMNLYPNPASNNITIEYLLSSDQTISVELLSIEGKIIKSIISKEQRLAGMNTDILPIPENISSGLYFMRLSSKEGSQVKKLKIR